MESPDTFTLLPLTMDPQTKAITTSTSNPSAALATELAALNTLHRSLLTVEHPAQIPPPPIPVNPKRSAQVTKLRETGNAAFRKGSTAEALRIYTLALDMALQRPLWEPSGLVREEASALFSNRAQAHMAQREWAAAAVDAECSVELKRIGNAKAWWRRGRCLVEMGRVEEARAWVDKALEFDPREADLVKLKEEVEQLLAKAGKA